jgi:hypothetical protein
VHGLFRLPYCSGGFLHRRQYERTNYESVTIFDVAVIGADLAFDGRHFSRSSRSDGHRFEKSPQAGGRASIRMSMASISNQGRTLFIGAGMAFRFCGNSALVTRAQGQLRWKLGSA